MMMATTWTPAAYFRAAARRTASSASAATTVDAAKDGGNVDAAASGDGAATAHPARGVEAQVDGAAAEAARKRRAADGAATTVVEVEMTDAEAAEEPFYALIVLNQPLVEGFRGLWSRASVRICADGGANQLYDALEEAERERLLPSFIKGDLDSLREDVARYYRGRNVPVIQDHDQDTTDLVKCMDELDAWERRTEAATHPVLVCGALSGRFDHVLHTVHFLHRHSTSQRQIFLVSTENVACLLGKGHHRILVDFATEGPTCALVPCAGPATITTTGLQWNLERALCSFGGLISTSNALADTLVTVETDAPVLWSIERNRGGF